MIIGRTSKISVQYYIFFSSIHNFYCKNFGQTIVHIYNVEVKNHEKAPVPSNF